MANLLRDGCPSPLTAIKPEEPMLSCWGDFTCMPTEGSACLLRRTCHRFASTGPGDAGLLPPSRSQLTHSSMVPFTMQCDRSGHSSLRTTVLFSQILDVGSLSDTALQTRDFFTLCLLFCFSTSVCLRVKTYLVSMSPLCNHFLYPLEEIFAKPKIMIFLVFFYRLCNSSSKHFKLVLAYNAKGAEQAAQNSTASYQKAGSTTGNVNSSLGEMFKCLMKKDRAMHYLHVDKKRRQNCQGIFLEGL